MIILDGWPHLPEQKLITIPKDAESTIVQFFFSSCSPNPEVLDCVQSEKAKLLQKGVKDISLIAQILTDLVLGAKPLGATEQRQGIAIMLTFRKWPSILCHSSVRSKYNILH